MSRDFAVETKLRVALHSGNGPTNAFFSAWKYDSFHPPMNIRSLISFTVLVLFANCAQSQEPATKSRLEQIQAEVDARRKLRETAQADRGIAFSPIIQSDDWSRKDLEFMLVDMSLVTCGQLLATLAQKEVLISGRVAKRQINAATGGSVSRSKALELFRRAIEEKGIAIVPVGERILVLLDSPEAPK